MKRKAVYAVLSKDLDIYPNPFPDALPYTISFGTMSVTRSAGSAKFTPLPLPCKHIEAYYQVLWDDCVSELMPI